uniref:Chemosensory protein n=1 Tax=Leucinodes orbonalis TaxID=711050 RepID=A0AAU0QMG0_9NEOP|nr:chemosensory protein [Leucinodes orbonalis]
MKVITVTVLVALIAMASAAPAEKYDDTYDGTNVEEIINNRRLLLPYIKCALDQGKCSADGKKLKVHIKDALATDCEKCTEVQKKNNKLVFKHLINKEKDYWKELVAKYDPERQYAPKFEKLYLVS